MKDHIKQVLTQIELEFDVKIIYACEAGSRSWGYPSEKSDYDIRFIYVHRVDWYLSIDEKKDVIELSNQNTLSFPLLPEVDVSGWEIRKALKLFRKSNPPLFEWLNSRIIYYQAYSTIHEMQKLAPVIFSRKACLFHYIQMAKRNYRDLKKRNEIHVKLYLNVLRPILAAKWIKEYQTIPPVEFEVLQNKLIRNDHIQDCIQLLINQKVNRNSVDLTFEIKEMNEFVEIELVELETYAKEIVGDCTNNTDVLNQIFRNTLKEIWTN